MKTKTITFVMMLALCVTYLGVTFVSAQGRVGAVPPPPPPAATETVAPPANPNPAPANVVVEVDNSIDDGADEETITLTDENIPTASTNSEGKISITLSDVEMVMVVDMFTQISGANIIATPSNLQGRVTVNLNDVEWKPALESILDMHHLMLAEKVPGSGVYSIVTVVPGAPVPMIVDTFFLKYASASDVGKILTRMLPSDGKVSEFSSRNALVVQSTAANIEEMKQVVAGIDILRDQVFIEAKFMELNDQAIKDLGINWQSLQGYSVTASTPGWTYEEGKTWSESRNDSLKQRDNRANNDQVLKNYDMYNSQFEENSTTWEEVPPGSGSYSPVTTITPTRTITDTIDRGKDITTDISKSYNKNVADFRSAILDVADFSLILSALKQMSGVSIVSNPKIIVANEESAKIHIGQTQRPFVSSVTPGQQGIAPIITYNPGDPVDFGVKLTVTPTINTESNITVKIEPELTRQAGFDTAPNGQTYPIISTKKISTKFCLESGKTVAIGGMTDTRDEDRTTKIPLLGDIPIIGKYLFSHTHKEKSQQETIIFVTVSLANPGTINENDGLPEDTELTQRHRLRTKALREKARSDLEELSAKEDAKTESDERRMRRLLRRKR